MLKNIETRGGGVDACGFQFWELCLHKSTWTLDIGASVIISDCVGFRVWAPAVDGLSVKTTSNGLLRETLLCREGDEYFTGMVEGVREGDRYFYGFPDGSQYPDPASRFQPEGVHGPSAIVDTSSFKWDDQGWRGVPLEDYILYELHVGTFTEEGTFFSIIPCLDYLKELGVTAVELMPVAQFPGTRNWGYDGVYPFAPQNSYGGPKGLKKLINACHEKELSVVLDVVCNHLGPEGNYLAKFGPYFTDRYRTPWGDAINFDGPLSDGVRHYFISNALYWVTEFHVDALRIDAIHGIFDFSAHHFLAELGEAVHRQGLSLGRNVYVIPESDLNDVRVINPRQVGGYGLDAQWNDDFHHALHCLLTGERNGYYQDFGKVEHLEKAFREGFVYSGQHSSFRKRRHGNSSKGRPAHQFVVFSQNHDQVGNRALGDRLSRHQSFEKLKLAATVVLLSPFIPLLFMGEEYGETVPFQYFVDHSGEELIKAVRQGRQNEFSSFAWTGDIPDPQSEETFLRSKINTFLSRDGEHQILHEFYRYLIALRKETLLVGASCGMIPDIRTSGEQMVILVRNSAEKPNLMCLFNFSDKTEQFTLTVPPGRWEQVLDSLSRQWGGEDEEIAPQIIDSHGLTLVALQRYGRTIWYSPPGSRPRSSAGPCRPWESSELLRAEGEAGYPLAGGALPVEGATQAGVQSCISSHSEREGEAPTALPVEGATQAGVQSCISSHSEREGEAPTASLVEGATRAPLIDSDGSEITLGLRPWGALAYRLKEAKGNLGESP
ncbi:MAG: Malto-oligosyltrehalose trehalohydrolase [Syntrophorhabdus sp. PtaU1.Bin050]|nr:MAG: Malto-oligosyltrehalose trehalohydrolase [Syntrophorhabdus sp. PtaU1.Bin050]